MNAPGPQPETRTRGWTIAVAWTVACLVLLAWSLAAMRIDRTQTVDAGAQNLRQLIPYWLASAAIWCGLTAIWRLLRCDPSRGMPRFGRTAAFILLIAMGVRIAVLIGNNPGLSDDVYRYIFDGRNLARGINPYLVRPEQRLNAETERWPGESRLVPEVNHRRLATPYLPVSQCVFGALGLAVTPAWSEPESSGRVFRVGFTAIELAMISLMLIALKRRQRSAWWAALYAWHPLPISEVAGSGHQDVVGMVFLVASLACFASAPAKSWRWAALLALSALGKPFTLPAGAMILRRRPLKEWIWSLTTGAVVATAAIAPFWMVWGDHGRAYHEWRSTADELTEKFAHFGGVYEPVLHLVQTAIPAEGRPAGFNLKQEWLARKICLGFFAMTIIGIYLSRLDAWRATRAILFALVLLTTTAHPWYLLWAFALAPMGNSWALWVFSLTLPWGYIVLGDVVNWHVPAWAYWAAYVPVMIALAVDVVLHFTATKASSPAAPTP